MTSVKTVASTTLLAVVVSCSLLAVCIDTVTDCRYLERLRLWFYCSILVLVDIELLQIIYPVMKQQSRSKIVIKSDSFAALVLIGYLLLAPIVILEITNICVAIVYDPSSCYGWNSKGLLFDICFLPCMLTICYLEVKLPLAFYYYVQAVRHGYQYTISYYTDYV